MASNTIKMETLEPRQLLTVGAPDPTFGVNGVATFRHIGGLKQLLAEPDGKLLGIGNDLLVQFNSDGSLDTNFGSGGEITPVFTPVDAAFDSSGNIVIAATFNNDILVIRYNSEGQLDDSFGNNGVAVLQPDAFNNYTAGDVAVQADDKIVVAGIESSGANTELVISRLNTDSSLDTSFGGTGIVDSSAGPTTFGNLAITAIGNIVASTIYINPQDVATGQGTVVLTTLGSDGAFHSTMHEADQEPHAATYGLFPTGTGDRVIALDATDGLVSAFASSDASLDDAFGAGGEMQLGSTAFALVPEAGGNFIAVNGDAPNYGFSLSEFSSTTGSPVESFAPVDVLYPTLNGYSIQFSNGAAVTSNGDPILFGTVKGHLALVKLQVADSGATNPTATVTNFVAPRIGGKYGYVTVQFTQGATALATSDVAADRVDMTYNGNDKVVGTLVSATGGGSGQGVIATYVVKVAEHGVNRSSIGQYQFTISPDAIVDSSGAGNVGEALSAFELYVPPRSHGNVVLSSAPLLGPIFNDFG